MNSPRKNVAILGATGSIGTSTLDVIAALPEHFSVFGLTANSSVKQLTQLVDKWSPRFAVLADQSAQAGHASSSTKTDWQYGSDAVADLAAHADVDIVVSAIVGSAGLKGTWAALQAGKTVALANKETMVVAGPLATELARTSRAKLLPVDSEHSAIFQALTARSKDQIQRLILTASGGPFRDLSKKQLETVTVEQALAHPTWDMGPKITVDSATMMNKALEIIEARWLFDLPAEKIDVMVHPQSIVHSMVEYIDGSVLAQLSPPDMKLPIQYALTYPDRVAGPATRMDWSQPYQLQFLPPDEDRFPALRLGKQVAKSGGTAGAVLNAANEAAVAGFLEHRLGFHKIVPACQAVLEQHEFDPTPTLDQLLKLDVWARQEVDKWICR